VALKFSQMGCWGVGSYRNQLVKHMAMNLVRNPKDKHSLKVRRKLANGLERKNIFNLFEKDF
jgi:hypothetical protein